MRMVASIVSIGVIGLLSLPSGVHAQEARVRFDGQHTSQIAEV